MAAEPGLRGESVSTVVPACNEEAVIARCLDGVLDQDFTGFVRVVVVANGCSDRTAEVASARAAEFEGRGWELRVVAIEQAGKPIALNAGDAHCVEGSRIYLDADVELSANAITEVAGLLKSDAGVKLAMPRFVILEPRSFVSCSYVRVWRELPRVKRMHVGSGFYAVSSEGRQRWGMFPPIISDDDFVAFQFGPEETGIAENAFFAIHAPEGMSELFNVRARWCRGTDQLRAQYPSLRARSKAIRKGAVWNLIRNPRIWSDIPIFVLVVLLAEWSAFRHRKLGLERWERAEQPRRTADHGRP